MHAVCIHKKRPVFPAAVAAAHPLRAVIEACWAHDAAARPPAEAVHRCLIDMAPQSALASARSWCGGGGLVCVCAVVSALSGCDVLHVPAAASRLLLRAVMAG